MASMREIRSRIKSIKDTMKITNAMYLISSSKLRKAKKQLSDIEPYFEKIQSTMVDILQHTSELDNKYFDERSDSLKKKKGYIIITGDKGMAGAYNHNVIKLAESVLSEDDENLLFLIGNMGKQYFKQKNVRMNEDFLGIIQEPTVFRARAVAEAAIGLFEARKLDEVYMVYTKMLSSVKIEPQLLKLLPLEKTKLSNYDELKTKYEQIATYEPSPNKVFNHLVPNYIKGLIFGALIESHASEHQARMMAMDSATNSAKEMIKSLELAYNRARQAAITQEISEIVGGAQSLK
ncbi:MAG: ATP synthase F1 subunit gamma [Clostridia bacterium]|nr:ATP synthase F1 subunit gamma [Clostridia bacterium]